MLSATEFSGRKTDMQTQTTPAVSTAATDGGTDGGAATARRTVAALGLLGIALIHLLDLPSKFEEATYLAVAYIGLIVASLVVAEGLIRRGGRLIWTAAVLLSGAVIVGFVINRTVGMPGVMGDIGNWLEPLGMASLFVEGVVVLLSLSALTRGEQLARRVA
jgi:hypothetical protein